MQKVSFFLVLFFNFNSQNRPLSSSILVSLSPPANMYDLVCIELDYHRAQYGIERDTLLFIRGTENFNWCSMVVELEVKLIEHDTPSANQSGARIGIGARGTWLELGCPDTKTDPKTDPKHACPCMNWARLPSCSLCYRARCSHSLRGTMNLMSSSMVVELDVHFIELHNHRARHQFHGTSKKMTTSSSIT